MLEFSSLFFDVSNYLIRDIDKTLYKEYSEESAYKEHFISKWSTSNFIYPKELNEIVEIINNTNEYKILIVGDAGSGKTTCLAYLSEYLQSNIQKNNSYIDSKSIDRYLKNYWKYTISQLKENNGDITLLIDDISLTNDLEGLLKSINKSGLKRLIATSRSFPEKDLGFDRIVNLKPLNNVRMDVLTYYELLRYLALQQNTSLMQVYEQTKNLLSDSEVSKEPRELVEQILKNYSLRLDGNKHIDKNLLLNRKNLLYQYGNGIELSSQIIVPEKKIITPTNEIITDVTVLDKELLKRVKMNPAIIDELSPREFEEMVCDFFDAKGYKVNLTGQTRDGGKDIIVTQKSLLGDYVVYVECKKYDKDNPVRVKLVRELYGTVMADNVTAGMMVTTSYYTRDAKQFRETVKNRMTLMEYEDLIRDICQCETSR